MMVILDGDIDHSSRVGSNDVYKGGIEHILVLLSDL